jgi:hypothetical protein
LPSAISLSNAAVGILAVNVRSQLPAHHLARERIEDHGQQHPLTMQPDISDVGHPKLIETGQLHPAGQVQIDLEIMIGISGYNERFWLHRQEIVLAYQPCHAFVWFTTMPRQRNSRLTRWEP